jgi:hypothetical protein
MCQLEVLNYQFGRQVRKRIIVNTIGEINIHHQVKYVGENMRAQKTG